jgi:hypothetical protein
MQQCMWAGSRFEMEHLYNQNVIVPQDNDQVDDGNDEW